MGIDTVDSYIQLPADGSGKKVDESLITRHDGSQVYGQRVNISDPVSPDERAGVSLGQLQVCEPELRDTLTEILFTLKEINQKLGT